MSRDSGPPPDKDASGQDLTKNSNVVSIQNLAIQDYFPSPYLVLDDKCQVLYANQAARRQIDQRIFAPKKRDKPANFVHYIKRGKQTFLDWLEGDDPAPMELRVRFGLQAKRCVVSRKVATEHGQKRYHLSLCVVDSGEMLDAEFNSHRLVFKYSPQAIYISDRKGKITAVNPAFCKLFRYSEQEILSNGDDCLYDADTQALRHNEVNIYLEHNDFWRGRVVNLRRDGEAFQSSLHVAIAHSQHSDDYHYVHIIEDIHEQVKLEDQLQKNAEIDALTGLNNRLAFNRIFAETFEDSQRSGDDITLFFIDLDRFKELNDQFGHDYGDELLIHVGQRLRNALKGIDFIGRLGGDEFVVFMRGALRKETIAALGKKLIDTLAKPFKVKDIRYQCTSSIGIARYPHDALDATALIQAADSAMYLSKQAGRNRCFFYNEEIHRKASAEERLREDIAQALENGQIQTHYQPIHHLLNHDVVGFEALVRWIDEDGKVIPPREFLPSIANHDLMISLGKKVAKRVLQLNGIIQRQKKDLHVSMNLSPMQLRSDELLEFIEVLFQKRDTEFCRRIYIEITESMTLDGDPVIVEHLQRLSNMGFRLLLDNFGKENSSIYSLKRYDFSTVKIDRVFVDDISDDESQSAQILTGLIQLLSHLDVQVICQGVETDAQRHFLLDRGCYLAQGTYYSEPIAMNKVLGYLRRFDS